VEGVRGSVIVPAWNAADVLADCLDSVAAQELPGRLETIVVDNASTDGTAELLRERAGTITVISNDENAGFSGANNQAARIARGRILFYLNSDTELLAPDTLARLADAVEAAGVGVAGPRLVNPDGSLQPSCAGHPSVGRALVVGSGVHRVLPDRLRARAAPHTWSHGRSMDTGWVKGAAMAVRADVFHEVGGFWPTMYAEEQDLAYKVAQRGLRVHFESSARVMHVGNQGNAQRWSDIERAARVANAELVFLRTHYARPRAAAIRAITGSAYALRAVMHRLLRHAPQARVYRSMARAYAAGPRD
jgi:GT2 family glycosyltransferase